MKFIDRNLYKVLIAKKSISFIDVNILAFNKNDELKIVSQIIKYTRNFLVLITDTEKNITFNKYHMHPCSSENVDIILSCIFKEKICCDDIQYSLDDASEREYIVFIPGDKLECDDCTLYDFNIKSFFFTYMTSNLKQFDLYDYYFYNDYAIVRLTDTHERNDSKIDIIENGECITRKKIILSPLPGIGDYFMMFSLVYEYVKKQLENGIEVFFTEGEKNNSVVLLLNNFFPSQKKVFFDNEAMYNYCLSYENKELVSILSLHIQERRKGKYNLFGCHISDAVKPILNLEQDFHVYTHNNILLDRINSSIDAEEKKYLDEFFANEDYIGFQFFTGTYDEAEEKWITDRERNWDNDNVREFVNLCNDAQIKLLTFSNHPYTDIQVERLKNVSVLGFIYAISKLKLLVGIDSSGGHIAACYKVPSITVWGKQTPEYFYNIGIKQESLKHNKISYRPLRKNISIWSKDRCIEKIGFKIVFDKMLEVINGGVNLSEDVLDYDNHSNCFIME